MIYFLPLLLLLLSYGQAHAYTTQTPEISGYNSRTMRLTGSTGGYSGGTYSRTGTVLINGKTVPIPGSLKPPTTMGKLAKAAMRANPYLIVGTLAAGYLIDEGVKWLEDQQAWGKAGNDGAPVANKYWFSSYPPVCNDSLDGCTFGQTRSEIEKQFLIANPNTSNYTWNACTGSGETWACVMNFVQNAKNYTQSFSHTNYGTAPDLAPVPMTDEDWNALSDPMPKVANELPDVAYLPEGVTIVEPPAYIPQTVTVGAPYTKADGSTAQPMARISPAGDGQVTIDTYEQPLTNPDGTAVPADTPTKDTNEEPAPPKDPCIENPDRLGCMKAGTDTFAMPKKTIDFSFTPEASPIGAGSCPAPISVLGHQISYQPACDAMGMIRALVIGMAAMTATFILVGGFKTE